MRQLEKPELISTVMDKKKVWLNIRESRLMYMFHRKLISWEEYEAGSRYRLMCELMGGGTGNVLKERVDGGATVSGGSGGSAAGAGFIVQGAGTTVLGFSFTGSFINAGCGTLTDCYCRSRC